MAPVTKEIGQIRPHSGLGPLHNLPQELRNLIWGYTLDWPDLSNVPSEDVLMGRGLMPPEKKKKWSTPSILLVDKQISAEALDILYAKPLIFDSKAPSKPWSTAVKDIRTYISKKTLQRLRFAIVKINLNCTEDKFGAASWWMKNVNILLKVWYEKNKMEQLTIRASHTTPHPLHARKTRYHRIMCEIINKCEKFGRDALVVVVIEPKIDT